jgi:hypothetical protein
VFETSYFDSVSSLRSEERPFDPTIPQPAHSPTVIVLFRLTPLGRKTPPQGHESLATIKDAVLDRSYLHISIEARHLKFG